MLELAKGSPDTTSETANSSISFKDKSAKFLVVGSKPKIFASSVKYCFTISFILLNELLVLNPFLAP